MFITKVSEYVEDKGTFDHIKDQWSKITIDSVSVQSGGKNPYMDVYSSMEFGFSSNIDISKCDDKFTASLLSSTYNQYVYLTNLLSVGYLSVSKYKEEVDKLFSNFSKVILSIYSKVNK